MGLLDKVHATTVAGARWEFPRLTYPGRMAIIKLISDGELNDYQLIARQVSGVSGLTEADGAPVTWPADEAARLDVAAALPPDDVTALAKFFLRNVLVLPEKTAGN